eukprot:CAMPEP_0197536422 /NCGR_PEP_ID=MMETSP1318-20131121/53823_1 /TAXON_ID=552666 /ORGANISM="Partenskyella glossopodia, Strain RCC365" /LENGTH=59 /DNA_ID=CAMNT_0043094305 /DNA_START=15 /DNA_END=194 /DNA_ORIENTATION=-
MNWLAASIPTCLTIDLCTPKILASSPSSSSPSFFTTLSELLPLVVLLLEANRDDAAPYA